MRARRGAESRSEKTRKKPRSSLGAGYRTLSLVYDKSGEVIADRRIFDASMHGPELWITLTW